MGDNMGDFFRALRQRAGLFKGLLFAVLGLLVVLNYFLRPEHPHVEAEVLPGFWAVFGLAVAVAMAAVMKTVIGPLLAVREDFYDD